MIDILPVMDLLDGAVVRGVAGQRESYRPIESRLAPSAAPADVASALMTAGYSSVYVADLDAIMHRRLSTQSLREILDAGLEVWLDAGFTSKNPGWPTWLTCQVAAAVIGSESAPDELSVRDWILQWKERAVLSIDLQNGVPMGAWSEWKPLDVARLAHGFGCRRYIVLDLAQVGMDGGLSTLALCEALRTEYPDVEITSGGGVRDRDDVRILERHGCDFALVATAIHDGRL